MEIIVGRTGEQKITIDDKTVSRQHCKLTSIGDGRYTLENISASGTFVNGQAVIKTTVTGETVLQLGPQYKVKVADLVGVEKKTYGTPVTPRPNPKPQAPVPPEAPTYSIRTLRLVWNQYQETLEEIKAKQKRINTLRSASPIFTIGSGVLATLAKTNGWGSAILGVTALMTIIGFCLMVYIFFMVSKDNSAQKQKEALDKFQMNYLCPNPKCGHTLTQDPKILLLNKTCPFCKCNYTE